MVVVLFALLNEAHSKTVRQYYDESGYDWGSNSGGNYDGYGNSGDKGPIDFFDFLYSLDSDSI